MNISPDSGLALRLLGPLAVTRDGAAQAVPPSRKLRALLGYLALAPRPVSRSRLCELLWDVPNDPRGELRWCLSKLRGMLDGPDRRRVVTEGDSVALDLGDCAVDALQVSALAEPGFDRIDTDQLRTVVGLFGGDLLQGLELDRCPHFDAWLAGQRRHFHAWHTAALERLAARMPAGSDAAVALLEDWLDLAPFDARPHLALLGALAARGEHRACENHLAAAARLFEAEGLDFAPVRDAWKASAPVSAAASPATVAPAPPVDTPVQASAARRASLAVMPFSGPESPAGARGSLADGLTHDIISRLARLRSLFVIARGSVFALAEQGVAPEEAARRLNVDYIATGSVRRRGDSTEVEVELAEARSARIVWSETFEQASEQSLAVLDAIGDRIVASIASEVEAAERNRALLKPPSSLDAWEAYHRGLWHMYRFTREENAQARQFFDMAVRLDPTFARAHAGLSFTHWQSGFQQWEDREQQAQQAFASASQGLMVDDRDPAAHWAMGRALWLRGSQDESLAELTRAVDLSPNFALGHYALAFVQSQSGDPAAAIDSSDHSRQLSPFDPLLFGFLGTRAMALVRLGRFEEAADWALKAAARPNAHPAIQGIAALCLSLAGRLEEARHMATGIRRVLPGYNVEDFLRTFQFDADGAALFREGAKRLGLG